MAASISRRGRIRAADRVGFRRGGRHGRLGARRVTGCDLPRARSNAPRPPRPGRVALRALRQIEGKSRVPERCHLGTCTHRASRLGSLVGPTFSRVPDSGLGRRRRRGRRSGSHPDEARALAWARSQLVWQQQEVVDPPLRRESHFFVSGNLATYLVAIIAGLGALGALRAASILLGPAVMIIMGLGLVAVPEGARSLSESPEKLRRTGIGVSAVSAACVLVWGFVVFLLPSDIGRELVGISWDDAHALLIPLTLAGAASAATVGAISGLKALQAAPRILWTRIVEGAIMHQRDRHWGSLGGRCRGRDGRRRRQHAARHDLVAPVL